MPRLSGDTLLQRAIEPAVQDRVSLADSFGRGSPGYSQCIAQAKAFEGLRGKQLASLSDDERTQAFRVFVCAEQWEASLADANHNKGAYARTCRRAARLYREFRWKHFGRTAMEADLADARSVDVREFQKRPPVRNS